MAGAFLFIYFLSFSSQHFFLLDQPPPAVLAKAWDGVKRERGNTHIVIDLQARVRSPRLDTFFLQTSILGAHTFFLAFLPFFFGYDSLGRG